MLIGSCGAEGTRLWNTKSCTCTISCITGMHIFSTVCTTKSHRIYEIGYGVSLAFAPGNRYLLVGTRDGKLQVKLIPFV
jgi:hypothetical protein